MATEKQKRNNGTANLKPWKPGQSGNPNGRPKKDCSLTSLLKAEIDKVCPDDQQGRTWRQVLVQSWLEGSRKSFFLFKELLDRLDGKPVQPVEHSGGVELRFSADDLIRARMEANASYTS